MYSSCLYPETELINLIVNVLEIDNPMSKVTVINLTETSSDVGTLYIGIFCIINVWSI